MKILVFSDTHGNPDRMLETIGSQAHDLVVHLGDCVRDALKIKEQFPEENLRYVAGNDLYDVMSGAPRREVFALGKVVVFASHGHDYGVHAGLSRLAETAQMLGAKLVLYGHTHVPHIETRGGVTYFNPGSCSLDRSGLGPGWGLVTIEGEDVQCELKFF